MLIILQLCRVALPLMNGSDCEKVLLPAWGQDIYTQCGPPAAKPENNDDDDDMPAKIASLLLAKLGDFMVPGQWLN